MDDEAVVDDEPLDDEPLDEEEPLDEPIETAPISTAPPVTQETAPPKPYVPQFHQSTLSPDERDKIKGGLRDVIGTWDADAIADHMLGVLEDVSARRTNAAVRNLMASQERAASTPEAQIAAIAQNQLFEAAQSNPGIYDDPQAVEGAQFAAALRYGYQTGDIASAIEKVLNQRKPQRNTPSQQQQQQTPTQRPRNQEGQFVPVASAANGGGSGARRTSGGNSDLAELQKRFPFVKSESELRKLMGE